MKAVNWADVVADDKKEKETIAPGGYICRIKEVTDNEDNETLKIVMDIEEGEHAHYGDRKYDETGYSFGYLTTGRKYSIMWQKSFKAFLVALEESNRRFYADKFDNDPKSLEDMLIGAVVANEEYAHKNREGVYIKDVRPKVIALVSVDRIKKGDFTVPDKSIPMSEYYANLLADNPGEFTKKKEVNLPF